MLPLWQEEMVSLSDDILYAEGDLDGEFLYYPDEVGDEHSVRDFTPPTDATRSTCSLGWGWDSKR